MLTRWDKGIKHKCNHGIKRFIDIIDYSNSAECEPFTRL